MLSLGSSVVFFKLFLVFLLGGIRHVLDAWCSGRHTGERGKVNRWGRQVINQINPQIKFRVVIRAVGEVNGGKRQGIAEVLG